jgi:DNA modification methylase
MKMAADRFSRDIITSTKKIGSKKLSDSFGDFYAFLQPRIEEAYRILKNNGSFYFHIDYGKSLLQGFNR